MMRRDAKIGFVIGGILLAVLIVYVSVPSGKKHTQGGVSLDEGSKTDQSASTATPPAPDSNPTDAAKPGDTSAGSLTAGTGPSAGPTTAPVASANGTDPFSSGAANTGTDQSRGTAEDKWMLALNHGSVPPAMMTSSAPQLPSRTHGAATPRKSAVAEGTDVKSPGNTTPEITTPTDSTASSDTAAPATQPVTAIGTSGKMNTHVVQAGETISSIAKVAYGSANYWPYIIRANPGIVATKIRPGMTINMPEAADVKAGTAAGSGSADSAGSGATGTGTAAVETKIDPNTQYQVQAGDSLAKIAMKLYGSSNKWQPIYDLNKEAIGADPQKLKQKMVLKLPEPPTVKS